MPYIGNLNPTLESSSNFRVLDDISSFTQTFNPSSSGAVDTTTNRIKLVGHRFLTGQRTTYGNGGGIDIGGLSNDGVYFIIKHDSDHILLAASASDAISSIPISLSSTGAGFLHTLNVAFDGVNTKFRPTRDNGKLCSVSDAAQLQISINGVIQKPNKNTQTLTQGYTIENGGNILFATAPTENERAFWGQVIVESLASFDVTDYEVDNFTGDGTTTDFVLSRSVPNNSSVVVSIDGVVQHPTETDFAGAYSVYDTILAFSGAPSNGADISVRHLSYASPAVSDVTSFHGRVGNVNIIDSDPVVAIHSGGIGIGTVRTLNFVGAGNSIRQVGDTVEISIAGGSGGGGSGVIHKETFNVTTNQTIFDLANTYNTGYVDVFINGVRLSSTDFTETSSTRITLTEPAISGDVVDVLIHGSVVQNTILDSTIDNLHINQSLIGQLGGGEETVGTTGFLAEVISAPVTITVATASNQTVAPKAGDQIAYVKYEEVRIDNHDLIIDNNDFMIRGL